MKTLLERDALVLNYLPLANSSAISCHKYCPAPLELDDLKSTAYFALIKAADKYESGINISFGPYAKPCILGAIKDLIRATYQQQKRCDFSFDEENSDEPQDVADDIFQEFFEDLTKSLGEIEKEILLLYYVENYTLKEIGNKLQLTEARISQMLKKTREQLC